MTSLPKYTVSMLCHNKLELTQACMASVLKHSSDFELLITNNASSDGTREWLDGLQDARIKVVHNQENLGFKEPHEHALTLARGEFFILLNNDMVVCPEWLVKLAEPFKGNDKLAITGVSGTCCTIDGRLHGQPIGCEGRTEPEYVEGSCLCMPTGLVRKLGLFAPWLKFIYWEDTELSLRVRELGYEIKLLDLPMRHDKPGSTSKSVPACQEALVHNTEQMRKRWGWYFRRRDLSRRILVRRLGAHGDVLLATPALWALRQKYPHAEIGVITKCPDMLRGLGWLTMVTKKSSYYDEFIDLDLAYESRSDLHIVEAFAQKLEVKLPSRWQMHMAENEATNVWAERTARGSKLAILHPGMSCWPGKNWVLEEGNVYDVSRWEVVVSALRSKGYMTITVGDSNTPVIGADMHLAGLTTPQQLYALCKQASLFVGIDSMPQHVASAADTPSVVLFGPTNPKCIVRPTPRIITVQASREQADCVGEHGRRTKAVTQAPCDGACMRAITVDKVLASIERLERIVS